MAAGDAVIRGGHPEPEALEAAVPDPEVQAHLEACASCRVDRRVLLATDTEEEPFPSVWTGAKDGDQVVRTWLSSREAQHPASPSVEIAPPARVGRYVPDAVLGKGGMAVVYRASVTGRPEERVAIKVLTRPDPELRQRLRREGRLQHGLRHDNVVRVLEVVEHEGEPVLVMDYVAGPSLDALLRHRVLPHEVADRVGRDVLRGVAAAHRMGIVHRDLKPGNVLLAPSPDGFEARVGDFGIARGTSVDDSLKTRTGTVAGTPLYMAPEQLRDASRADARSDVFSLGALLYELVSGLRAFAGVDYVDVVRRVADVRYAPLSEVAPTAPARMVRAIEAALSPEPSDRPASAAELLDLWSSEQGVVGWPEAVRIETIALHQPRPLAVAPPPASAPHNLEPPTDVFVGRHADRSAVAALFERERLVTLTGPGGVGKTRLALEVGRDLLPRFPGGAWWCDLSDARGRDGIVRAVSQALGEPPGADPVEQIGQALRGRGRALLILDNFEQVVEHAAETVEVWLDRAPEASFLATSREPLDLLDEAQHAVEPLTTPGADSDRTDAVELFAARAAAAFPEFRLEPANRADVAELVRELDGLPLAIEIAAARVRTLDLGSLLRKLRPRLHDLPARDLSVTPRHRTLQATLDWSWDLLSQAERSALAQVSVFAGGFTAQAAEAVVRLPPGSPATAAVLDELVRRSLVRRKRAVLRYELLVSVREYAGRRLDTEAGARDAAEARHIAWFAAALYVPPDDDTEPAETLARSPDADNYVVACRRALRAGRPADAVLLCRTALPLLARSTPVGARIALAEEVLAADGIDELDDARLRLALGHLQVTAGDLVAAVDHHELALAAMRRAGLHHKMAPALNQLGLALWSAGRIAEAEAAFQESVEIGAVHAPVFAGYSLGALGVIALNANQYELALERFARALEVHRALGNRRGEALVLGDTGVIHHRRGDLERAIPDLERSLALLPEADDRVAHAMGLLLLAEARLALGETDVARELLTSALRIDEEVGAVRSKAAVLLMLAHVESDDEAAGRAFEAALAAAREAGMRSQECVCLAHLATLRARAGAPQRAAALLADAVAVGPGDDPVSVAELEACRAEVAWRSGSAGAVEHVERAEQALADGGYAPRSAAGRRLAEVGALVRGS